MAVVIQSEIWEPNKAIYMFLFVACFLSIYFSPHSSSRSSTVFDQSLPVTFLRFQRSFLALFALSSVLEGLWPVFGEHVWAYNGGISWQQVVFLLCLGCVTSFCFSPVLGALSDIKGQRKLCLLFFVLHLFVAIWRRISNGMNQWFPIMLLSTASSIFSFAFESWIIVEHDKEGQRQDTLNDMFWLMTFVESSAFIVSQGLSNWLIGSNLNQSIAVPCNAAMLIAIVSFVYATHHSQEASRVSTFTDYRSSFRLYILSGNIYTSFVVILLACVCAFIIFSSLPISWYLNIVEIFLLMDPSISKLMIGASSENDTPFSAKDWLNECLASDFWLVPALPSSDLLDNNGCFVSLDKRIWLLCWSQACVHLAGAVFWILWAPTTVADGREVRLGLIYPCLLGSRMLGSTVFPWFLHGTLTLRTEEYLVYVFLLMGLALSIVAYDYQDIGVLVVLFCMFHTCVGLVLPSLARLRSMYVPNELRGGMMGLSQALANAMFFFFLVQRSYSGNIGNSTVTAFAALGLFSAAGCLYLLKQSGKQLHHNWRKS